jgi:hypothetical protein
MFRNNNVNSSSMSYEPADKQVVENILVPRFVCNDYNATVYCSIGDFSDSCSLVRVDRVVTHRSCYNIVEYDGVFDNDCEIFAFLWRNIDEVSDSINKSIILKNYRSGMVGFVGIMVPHDWYGVACSFNFDVKPVTRAVYSAAFNDSGQVSGYFDRKTVVLDDDPASQILGVAISRQSSDYENKAENSPKIIANTENDVLQYGCSPNFVSDFTHHFKKIPDVDNLDRKYRVILTMLRAKPFQTSKHIHSCARYDRDKKISCSDIMLICDESLYIGHVPGASNKYYLVSGGAVSGMSASYDCSFINSIDKPATDICLDCLAVVKPEASVLEIVRDEDDYFVATVAYGSQAAYGRDCKKKNAINAAISFITHPTCCNFERVDFSSEIIAFLRNNYEIDFEYKTNEECLYYLKQVANHYDPTNYECHVASIDRVRSCHSQGKFFTKLGNRVISVFSTFLAVLSVRYYFNGRYDEVVMPKLNKSIVHGVDAVGLFSNSRLLFDSIGRQIHYKDGKLEFREESGTSLPPGSTTMMTIGECYAQVMNAYHDVFFGESPPILGYFSHLLNKECGLYSNLNFAIEICQFNATQVKKDGSTYMYRLDRLAAAIDCINSLPRARVVCVYHGSRSFQVVLNDAMTVDQVKHHLLDNLCLSPSIAWSADFDSNCGVFKPLAICLLSDCQRLHRQARRKKEKTE